MARKSPGGTRAAARATTNFNKLPGRAKKNLGPGSLKHVSPTSRESVSSADLKQIQGRRKQELALESESGLKRRGRP